MKNHDTSGFSWKKLKTIIRKEFYLEIFMLGAFFSYKGTKDEGGKKIQKKKTKEGKQLQKRNNVD